MTDNPTGTAAATALHVAVVAAPGLVADHDLLAEITDAESARLGVTGRLVAAADADRFRELLDDTGRDPETALVALPGPDPDVRGLMRPAGPHAARTVWCDLTGTGPTRVAAGSAHIEGRGIWGLTWALRHAVHRLRRPARRIRYGPGPDQWGELRMPPSTGTAPPPVAVLLHGGYWRSVWGADLMDALAIDLADRGYAAWNLEYRRPDRHGWAATTADVAAGLATLAGAQTGGPPPGLDLDRVSVIGHSAGGQLALRLAADAGPPSGVRSGGAVPVALAVSLAGVLDLVAGHRRGVGTGAVPAALGGGPEDLPERYAAADPMRRLPLGVAQLIVQGDRDDLDLIDFNRRYVTAAREAGEEVGWLELPGDHFSAIDPAAGIWHATVGELGRRLGRSS